MSAPGSTARAPSRRRPSTELLAVLSLVGITAVWGATFVVVKDAIARMPVMAFLAWRFGLATVVMVALRPRSVLALPPAGRRAGVVLGLALGGGYIAQTVGLQHTPASVSGFITGMLVVFTPLLGGLLLRQPVGRTAWLAVAVATVGLALISLRGLSVGGGEALTLACALCFALHIVGLGAWSTGPDAYPLAVVQLAVVTALCALAALPAGGLRPPPDAGVWAAVAGTAVLATALAFVGQTWAQAHLAPTRTAVVLTLEPVFAGVFGVLLAGDRLGLRTAAGGVLIVVAMLLTEVGSARQSLFAVERLEA